ncbi:hypothetical protein L484_009769 [Morus notabilis]|uniref:Uncharacterized protein n=1 Tax=Morus notabilis TaxID=981085 RepID=W9SJM8_9ROSA|nr:hypothetical protein L484_009769 [Morus notabilis]
MHSSEGGRVLEGASVFESLQKGHNRPSSPNPATTASTIDQMNFAGRQYSAPPPCANSDSMVRFGAAASRK